MGMSNGGWPRTAILAVLVSAAPLHLSAQQPDRSSLPVVTIDGPTVIMFSTNPESVSDPDARMGLYSALDQQQTMMADTREALTGLGFIDVTQPGRRFLIRDGTRETVFTASPDSSVVGYVLAAPGHEHRTLYRVHFPDALLEAVRAYLAAGGAVAKPRRPR